jgi:hypothetical protein
VSITRAQAKALADQFLETIGTGDVELATASTLPLAQFMLAQYAKDFSVEVGKNLKKTRSIGSGNAADVFVSDPVTDGGTVTVSIGYDTSNPAHEYYQYIDQGVKGATNNKAKTIGNFKFKTPYPNKKMAESIAAWLAFSGSKSQSTKAIKSIERKAQSLKKIDKVSPYAIATNIKKHGINAREYFTNAKKTVFGKSFIDGMQAAVGRGLIIDVKNIEIPKKR